MNERKWLVVGLGEETDGAARGRRHNNGIWVSAFQAWRNWVHRVRGQSGPR